MLVDILKSNDNIMRWKLNTLKIMHLQLSRNLKEKKINLFLKGDVII